MFIIKQCPVLPLAFPLQPCSEPCMAIPPWTNLWRWLILEGHVGIIQSIAKFQLRTTLHCSAFDSNSQFFSWFKVCTLGSCFINRVLKKTPQRIFSQTRVIRAAKTVNPSTFRHIHYLFIFSVSLSLGTIRFSWLQVSLFLCWQRGVFAL